MTVRTFETLREARLDALKSADKVSLCHEAQEPYADLAYRNRTAGKYARLAAQAAVKAERERRHIRSIGGLTDAQRDNSNLIVEQTFDYAIDALLLAEECAFDDATDGIRQRERKIKND